MSNRVVEHSAHLSYDSPVIRYLSSNPWLMEPSHLDALAGIVVAHINGERIEANLGGLEAVAVSTQQLATGKVAQIPLHGTVLQQAFGMQAICGARTTDDVRADIQEALNDPSVSGMVLHIRSPGGTVSGTKELADFIVQAKEQKPIIAFTDAQMCSAAMWIGSACTSRVATPTATIGSIGVIIKHQDASEALAKVGIKETYVFAGEFKAFGNSSEPLVGKALAYVQSKVQGIYDLFVGDIAANLGLDLNFVTTKLATAATFLGAEALELKLIDSIGSLEDALALATQNGGQQMAEKDPKVEVVVEPSQAMVDMQAQLSEIMGKLEKAEATATEAVEAKEAIEAANAKASHEAAVKALFPSCNVEADFMTEVTGMSIESATIVAREYTKKDAQVSELLTKLGEPTGETVPQKEGNDPTTKDEAVAFVEDKYKITDIDEALAKAASDFPKLFSR